MIEFLLNDRSVELDGLAPTLSVLDWLRTKRDLKGTKEGCASGDCGACTVVVGESTPSGVQYHSFNACLMLMGNLHGKHLITVDGLTMGQDVEPEQLHPAQRALVECHGSQCGFCTPGFVMSMVSLYMNERQYPGESAVIHALGGNLCRCTGYRPILDACKKMYDYPHAEDPFTQAATSFFGKALIEQPSLSVGDRRFHLPQSLEELLQLKNSHRDARIIAGGTDLSLEFTQQLIDAKQVISVTSVAQMQTIEESDGTITIGAAAPFDQFLPMFLSYFPQSKEMFSRLGSAQIRNAGTLGGSLANASPIGDPAPLLIALGGSVVIGSTDGTRQVPIEDFFLAYRKTVLAEHEVIVAITVPVPSPEQNLVCYKISKRIEDDISTVLFALSYELNDNRMTNVKSGFGGMAATPSTSQALEQALEGELFSEDVLKNASEQLVHDFNPMSDVRGSREYRLQVSRNLLQRLWLEQSTQQKTRVSHAAL